MSDKNKNILLEGEEEILLDHDYDGIQELDNPLPSWWKMTFYGGILFSIPYVLYYGLMGGPSIQDVYEKDLAKLQEAQAEMASNLSSFSVTYFENWVSENNAVEMGTEVYEMNCAACHLDQGQGDIGPNLTDAYWIHGDGETEFIYNMVVEGYEDNGMPAWGEILSKEEIMAVTAYVNQKIIGTNIEGKEPEGEKFE
jgi:cytochrome c oxidase cbb3-type subunit 3